MATLPCDSNAAVFDSNVIDISNVKNLGELCVRLNIDIGHKIQELMLEYWIESHYIDAFKDAILKAILGLFLEKEKMILVISDAILLYIENYRLVEQRCNESDNRDICDYKEEYCIDNGNITYYIAIFCSMKSFLEDYFESFNTIDIEHLFPLLIEIWVELIPYLKNDVIKVPLPENLPLEHIPPWGNGEKIMLPIPCDSESLYNYLVVAVTKILKL